MTLNELVLYILKQPPLQRLLGIVGMFDVPKNFMLTNFFYETFNCVMGSMNCIINFLALEERFVLVSFYVMREVTAIFASN